MNEPYNTAPVIEALGDARESPERGGPDEAPFSVDTSLKRAIIYIRVSTRAQAERDGNPEGYSLPTQRQGCQAKAKQLGATVVDEYVDKDTGTTVDKRPAMLRLIERVTGERDVDYVIVYQLSRFARNRLDDAAITVRLEAAGAQLISCMEGIDQSTAGRMLQGMLAVVNEYQSRNQGDDIRRKTLEKVKNGGTPHLAPIGYRNVRDGDRASIVVDEERAHHITWAFSAYATGNWSLNSLQAELTARGLVTRATAKKPGGPIAISTLAGTLAKRYYVGVVTFRGVEYDGKHEHLTDWATFLRVQQVLNSHNRSGEKHWKHDHYLKGTLYCDQCGGRLCIAHETGNGGRYVYFFCLGRARNRQSCCQRALQVDVVAEAVERHWRGVRIRDSRAEELRAIIRDELAEARDDVERMSKLLRRRIQQLNEQQQKLLDAYYADALPVHRVKAEQERIDEELAEASGRLAASTMSFEHLEWTVNAAINWARQLPEAYAQADDEVRRQLNQAVYTRMYVSEDGVTRVEYTEGMEYLLEARPKAIGDEVTAVGEEMRLAPERPGPLNSMIGGTWSFSFADGSNVNLLVEVTGLEPATSTLRT